MQSQLLCCSLCHVHDSALSCAVVVRSYLRLAVRDSVLQATVSSTHLKCPSLPLKPDSVHSDHLLSLTPIINCYLPIHLMSSWRVCPASITCRQPLVSLPPMWAPFHAHCMGIPCNILCRLCNVVDHSECTMPSIVVTFHYYTSNISSI